MWCCLPKATCGCQTLRLKLSLNPLTPLVMWRTVFEGEDDCVSKTILPSFIKEKKKKTCIDFAKLCVDRLCFCCCCCCSFLFFFLNRPMWSMRQKNCTLVLVLLTFCWATSRMEVEASGCLNFINYCFLICLNLPFFCNIWYDITLIKDLGIFLIDCSDSNSIWLRMFN